MAKLAELTLDHIRRVRCEVDEDSECWVWRTSSKGMRATHPQVHVWDIHRPVLVRRIVYEAKHGIGSASGLFVLSNGKCSTTGCCNPNHLKAVSRSAKNRFALRRANENKLKKQIANAIARRKYAKLTLEIVQEMRMLPDTGPDRVLDTELAAKYGVCRKTIGQARRGITWKNYGSVFGGIGK